MQRLALFTLLLLILSFKGMAQFTDKEIEIIRKGTSDESMRVLLTTDKQDSLVLRQKSENIDTIKGNADLHLLVQRLLATMEKEQGVGIAAPQVGILKNIFLFVRTDKKEYPVEVVINPRIVNYPDTTICFKGDGCLSVPDSSANTVRYPWIEVEYNNLNGKLIRERLEGYSRRGNFVSVIFQHEFDHLQGILFIDKICPTEE